MTIESEVLAVSAAWDAVFVRDQDRWRCVLSHKCLAQDAEPMSAENRHRIGGPGRLCSDVSRGRLEGSRRAGGVTTDRPLSLTL